jgi:outer membrane protein insertion porin family
MYKKIIVFISLLFCFTFSYAQENNEELISQETGVQIVQDSIAANDSILPAIAVELPNIQYSTNNREYEIAGITTSGAPGYEDFILIGFSGLQVGQKIKVPGESITNAIKRFWKQGLFSEVNITATKIEGDKIWLNIDLKPRPRISEINYHGLKKSEKDDMESKAVLIKGNQITQNLINRTVNIIQDYFKEKGFLNAKVVVNQQEDTSNPGNIIVNVFVDKGSKVRISRIDITGNNEVKIGKLKRAMKKTNEKRRLFDIFRTKKFIDENYRNDKVALIDKYNELGFRDAQILKDTVFPSGPKTVQIEIDLKEGQKYYFRNISWIGNTLYSSDLLSQVLRIKKGDIYNSKKLNDRLMMDEDAVSNLYLDNGYLFFHVEPVEVNIVGDSIDIEMRMFEGQQAIINKVGITGNTRVYENVVRRELRTKPGQLFSKTDLQRTMREIAQMGHFNPETLNPEILPNVENGTVDINYPLETKSSDQFEISAGWGSSGVIGSLAVKFTNFSIQNIFKPSTYRIVPQGDGQTLTLRAQTNARFYQSYGISFMEPWLGGKRPTSLSVSAFYSKQTGVSDRFYRSGAYEQNYWMSSLYGDSYYQNMVEYDDQKFIKTFGVSAGIGSRLTWPDDYFTLYGELAYQRYSMQNWDYFIIRNGHSNNFSLNLTFARNSINNPLYTSSGSSFSMSLNITPPYSLFSGKDYSKIEDQQRFEWIEYHKWRVKARTFTPLSKDEKFVFMARAEFGFLGYYNKHNRSPFESFVMGGDMMSSSYTSYTTETVGLRGYENGSLTPIQYTADGKRLSQIGNIYTKLSFELRYPLMTGMTTVYALAFFDAGNSWYDFKDFNPFQLKRSAGIGLRVILPMIGLIGVDWAYGFDKINGSYDYSKSQFHFVLGQDF